MLKHGTAERVAPGTGRQRGVDQINGLGFVARKRIKRVLEGRAEQDARVVSENLLGAVAVVHVEIDDGHALEPVFRQRVGGAYGDVVEQAEAHGASGLCVMSGRPHAAEGGVRAVCHDQVHAQHGCAGRSLRSAQRVRRHHCIAFVQADHFVSIGGAGLDPVDMRLVVHPRELCAIGQRRVIMLHNAVQPGCDQPVLDRRQPLGRFRVMGGNPVKGAVRMTYECKCHRFIVLDYCAVGNGAGSIFSTPRVI